MAPGKRKQLWKKAKVVLEKALCRCSQSASERIEEIRSEVVDRKTRAQGDPEGCSEEVQTQLAQISDDECRQIREALARGEAGEYAVCITCEGDIAEGRLEALPYATQCIDCVRAATVVISADEERKRASV